MTQIESFVNDQNASREPALPSLEMVSAVAPASCFFAYGATVAVTAWLVTKARGGKFDDAAPAELPAGVPSDMSGDQLVGLVLDLKS